MLKRLSKHTELAILHNYFSYNEMVGQNVGLYSKFHCYFECKLYGKET